MDKKIKVGVVFGGRSGEHEVSLVSATSVIGALDRKKYEVVEIGISKDGRWFSGDGVLTAMKSGKAIDPSLEVAILPEPKKRGVFNLSSKALVPVDIIFPVIHGTYGEDGTIQGLFELAAIPYVGAGVLGSSAGMDKIMQKDVVRQAKINTAPSLWFVSEEFAKSKDEIISKIEETLGYPCFIKPSNSGSSVGISKAHDRKELIASIEDAARYDTRVLVEKSVDGAREIEVAVLGNDFPRASCAGEVVPSNEFYDYDAKYVDGKSKTHIPAELPKEVEEICRTSAVKAFKVLNLSGMSRVDFLVTKHNEVYFNEVNTIPGFTSISMYPKLWEASGISYSALLDELIRLGFERAAAKEKLLTSYQPKNDWFRKS